MTDVGCGDQAARMEKLFREVTGKEILKYPCPSAFSEISPTLMRRKGEIRPRKFFNLVKKYGAYRAAVFAGPRNWPAVRRYLGEK